MRATLRYLLPLAALVTLAGYFGPWVGHRAAGLVIPGLDLGEYVKFLAAVRSGEVWVWREGFYLPLVTVSLALSLHAFREEWGYGWGWRALLLAVAFVSALNILPPAWSPGLLLSAEFRLQSLLIGVCVAAVLFSPFLALLPAWLVAAVVIASAAAAAWLSVSGFLAVLPGIEALYNHAITPAWGMWAMVAGLIVLIATMALAHFAGWLRHSSGASAALAEAAR